MNLLEKTFGRLTVIGVGKRKGYVLCRCTCGNQKEIRATSLTKTKYPTRSCGCIQKEFARNAGTSSIESNSKKQIATNMYFNTNFQVIESDKAPSNNTSGCKGVSFDSSRGLWAAYISVHGKRIHLGRYANKDEAIKARKFAEVEYFRPLIEEKEQIIKNI